MAGTNYSGILGQWLLGAGALGGSGPSASIPYLTGTVTVTSTVTGSLSAGTQLTGLVTCVSTVAGIVTTNAPLSGTVPVTSTVIGSLSARALLTGTVPITSSVTGSLSANSQLTGTVAVVSTVTGTLTTVARLTGTVTATSTVAGVLTTRASLSGVVTITSTVNGLLSVPLTALGHELEWIYATPTGTLLAAEIVQFLALHGIQVVSQGSPAVTVSGALATWQALGDVDQPFVAPANVGWVRVPLTSVNLAPTTESGWPGTVPITVAIYADSGGVPGALVASVVVPAEQVAAVQQSLWPEPDDLLFGPAVADAQASLPQLPGSGWGGMTPLVAGAWGILFATQGSSDTQMWVVPYDGADLGGWVDGSTLPVSGLSQAVYAPTSEVVVVLSGDLMWAATFSQTGVVGSWQQLPSIADFGEGLIGVLTYEGSDYLVAVAASGLTYYATLSSSGSIDAWTEGLVFPVRVSTGAAYPVGGDLVFLVQSGGLTTLVSIDTPGGGWSVSGTLSASSSTVLGVIGQAVITTTGTAIDATTLTELGTAPWSLPIPLSVSGADTVLLAFETGNGYVAFWIPTSSGATGYQQPVYVPSWVNVPLPVALTSGHTYHLVLSATNALTEGVAVPVASPSGSEIGGLIYNGTSWVSLGGVIPVVLFYGAGAPPLALIGTGKTTILWFDTPSGVLTTSVEVMGSLSTSRVASYDDGVLSGVA